MTWYWLAITAAIVFGINVLVIRNLADQGVAAALIMFYLYLVGCLLSLWMVFNSQIKLLSPFKITGLLILVGILSSIGMFTQIKSIALAPNPGYSAAIISAQTLVAALLAVVIFGSPLTTVKAIGILLTLAGVALIANNN